MRAADLPFALPDAAAVGSASPGRRAFDELRLASAADPAAQGRDLAAHWGVLLQSVGGDVAAALDARVARVRGRVHDDGATYTIHASGGTAQVQAWPLQLLPFVVPAAEWPALEAGVRQRARLLEATLVDLYGAQTLLREALLPPSLVFAHPQYLRPMHGVRPAGGRHLRIVAFDVARGPDGLWHVLAQRAQAPSGLGYALHNRLVVASELPEAFAALRVRRIAGAFGALIDGLREASPAGGEARIALLTPGPAHETWFEQVFLARQLGLLLVEAGDLTVRSRQLYMKTLHGLQRVDALLRRVDDEWIDPLELRPDSALGVPGLLQVLRAGALVMANLPGAGVLESPGLSAFWPALARRLLGEELQLPAATHWWCGEASVWQSQRERLTDYVVALSFAGRAADQAFDPLVAAHLGDAARARLAERIEHDPAAYTLQARLLPSQTPVWHGGRIESRSAVLRLYAVAGAQGRWQVMPGGLARVAAAAGSDPDPWLSMQHGAVSADTWVLGSADAPADEPPAASMVAALRPADLAAQQTIVSSRAAENLFWLGRYTERAEFGVALVRTTLEALPAAGAPARELLDQLARWHDLVPDDAPPVDAPSRAFEQALLQALPATSGREGVGLSLRSLATCARGLGERLSPEHTRLIDELGEQFEHAVAPRDPGRADAVPVLLAALERTGTHLSALTGAQTDRMARDDGWRLLSVGRQIERIDTLAHALACALERRLHAHDDGFGLLLALFDCAIVYRARFQTRRELLPLVHLLVADIDHPRSLAWAARTLRDRLVKLARHDPAWGAAMAAGVPAPEAWALDALTTGDGDAGVDAIVQRLHALVDAVRALSDAIGERLFAHVDDAGHAVWQ